MQIPEDMLKNQDNQVQNMGFLYGDPLLAVKNNKCCFGQWNDKEILKYFLFVFHHKQKFQSKSMRKSLKVFKQMAKFVKTRNSSQCRTHHQNLMNKCRNLDNALKKFVDLNPSFFDKYQSIKESLSILDDMQFCEDTSTVVRLAKQEDVSEMQNSSTEIGGKVECQENNTQVLVPEPINGGSQVTDLRAKKVLECQLLFSMWASKISQLIQISVE